LGYAAGGGDLSQPAGFFLSDPRPPAGGRGTSDPPPNPGGGTSRDAGVQANAHLRDQPQSGAVASRPPCASPRDPLDIKSTGAKNKRLDGTNAFSRVDAALRTGPGSGSWVARRDPRQRCCYRGPDPDGSSLRNALRSAYPLSDGSGR